MQKVSVPVVPWVVIPLSDCCKALEELRSALGEEAISTDEEDLHMHGYSEQSSINIETLPIAVAYPKNTEEVSKIAKVCNRYKVPMSELMAYWTGRFHGTNGTVPFSGGSSLEANFAAPYGGMSIDFSEMDKVLEFHPDE
jgi:D-lactate dehydrogenase (cytochrome)